MAVPKIHPERRENNISHGDQHLIAPAEQHDDAAAKNVKPSPLLPEGSVEPPHLPPLPSKLHSLMKESRREAWCKANERKKGCRDGQLEE